MRNVCNMCTMRNMCNVFYMCTMCCMCNACNTCTMCNVCSVCNARAICNMWNVCNMCTMWKTCNVCNMCTMCNVCNTWAMCYMGYMGHVPGGRNTQGARQEHASRDVVFVLQVLKHSVCYCHTVHMVVFGEAGGGPWLHTCSSCDPGQGGRPKRDHKGTRMKPARGHLRFFLTPLCLLGFCLKATSSFFLLLLKLTKTTFNPIYIYICI